MSADAMKSGELVLSASGVIVQGCALFWLTSMLAVEDYLCALDWAESVGGLQGLIKRSETNFDSVSRFVEQQDWIDFLAEEPETRSTTSVCPWKGTAHYYDVVVGESENGDAAWCYPEPKDAAAEIEDRVAFWRGVEVVDG